ncbi:MAG: beta-lactamase family protein, partial [Bacteroidota bacterium]|nr:beta-lactamase family protein [Bacteroidota bacterium]
QKAVDTSDLGEFPLNVASNKVNLKDSSVTTTVLGIARQKALYRNGIGCTLINDISEDKLRSQVFVIPPPPVLNTDLIAWPAGDKVADSISTHIHKNKLDAAIAKAFMEPTAGKKQRTRAVLIVYNGQIVGEKYAPGFDKNMKMYGWSMAKSFTGAMIGILVKENKLNILKPAPVAEWRDPTDPRHAITIQNLLQQTSGLDFGEVYTKSSDVTRMLFQKGDMAAYAAAHKLAFKPGTVFNYSSGNSNILARIIRQTVGQNDYASFPFTSLFFKIGMYNTNLEPDASGTYVGSSYVNATARDYARFGLLYCNNGVWNGEQILPGDWVKQTTTPFAADPLKHYGYQFWLSGFDKDSPNKRKYPDVPADMFYCDGFGVQMIYIIPSKKLVAVRLGLTLDRSFDENAFLKSILAAIDKKQK